MPSIAIIGRQNVGKSTLFNALIGTRKSIAHDQPGVTRDIVSLKLRWGQINWEISDFPGFENISGIKDDPLARLAIENAIQKLQKYHLLLWTVSRSGLTAYEYELHKILRTSNQKFWLLVNFTDSPSLETDASDFYSLGISKVFFISALNYRNIVFLKESMISHFINQKSNANIVDKDESEKFIPEIAIIGKPNVGKSTLFNYLLQKTKALTSAISGTTRDSLDEEFYYYKKKIKLIDTAGLRKKRSAQDHIEKFSVQRTYQSIERANVVILLMDPLEGFDRQIKTILNLVNKMTKPLLLGINKSDILKERPEIKENIQKELKEMRKIFWNFPVEFVSALKGDKTSKLIRQALELHQKSCTIHSTSKLNAVLKKIKGLSIFTSNRIKLSYITQKEVSMHFILFSNQVKLLPSVNRFLTRSIQKHLEITELPVKIENRFSNKK